MTEQNCPKHNTGGGPCYCQPEILGVQCKDGGACHHGCSTECFRKVFCEPLSGSCLNQKWEKQPAKACAEKFDFLSHLKHQRWWSEKTFGPGERHAGIIDHISKELSEIYRAPTDLEEWIDVVILALDGAWRAGHSPEQIIGMLIAKQAKNEARVWPDWRTAAPGKAIEHVRDELPEDYEVG